jgi:RecB family exonuclease
VSDRSRAEHRRVLVRARDLAEFRRALVDLALAGDPLDASRRAMILPTRASIEIFRQTIEHGLRDAGRTAVLLPQLLTRDDWIGRLHQALGDVPPMLTRLEREVLMDAAARAAARRGWLARPPFEIRPRLVTEILRLYDELRRRRRSVGRFSRVLFDELRVERGTDRGSESLIHQTTFLGFAFLGYERRVAASERMDEHGLRIRLLDPDVTLPFDRLVVAVADHPSDPSGLWPADFDLIGRLAGLTDLAVVVTDRTHDAGFRDRIEQELPGIEEVRAFQTASPRSSVLVRPAVTETESLCYSHRDREEELRDVVRAIRREASSTGYALRGSTAVVFQRPLPYVYLARQVFADGRVPLQIFDALPLAAEPYASLVDLVLVFAATGGTREAAVALLRAPALAFRVDGSPIGPEDVAALDLVLTDGRATGEADTFGGEVDSWCADRPMRQGPMIDAARRAARAAAAVHAELVSCRTATSGSAQVRAIASFLRAHERGNAPDARQSRARAAVLGLLDALAAALASHHDEPRDPGELVALVHHGIEQRTFTPAGLTGGVCLVDAVAARFGEFDHVHLVGLVETDWLDRSQRSIFYSRGMLSPLGWPQDAERRQAQQAAFRDLIELPARTLRLHAFQFDGEALVAQSPMVEMARELSSLAEPPSEARRIFADELLTSVPPVSMGLDDDSARWLEARTRRPPLHDRRYSGFVATRAPQAYRVSLVDRYVDCPFKYFAHTVLDLPEEREEASGLTPLERGTLVHHLFERFYRAWHAAGRGAITPATLPDALSAFAELAREVLSRFPEADRALEEARLLGSIVGRGVAERVFELESDSGAEVVDRFVELDLRGRFNFPALSGISQREIEIRGKADRIDVFDTGGLRVVDYKLSRLPDVETSVQLPVYAHAARQLLEARDRRVHPVTEAMYVAFGDERRTAGKLATSAEDVPMAVEARSSDFAAAIESIEAGRFPAQPKRPGDCQWCHYAGVCRKEYFIEDGTS